jgi:toxin ParE1/3/4
VAQTRRLTLRYTRPALDLRSILDYIAAQSPHGARRVHARIKTVIDLLLLHPNLGRRTSHPTIRPLAATPYPYL